MLILSLLHNTVLVCWNSSKIHDRLPCTYGCSLVGGMICEMFLLVSLSQHSTYPIIIRHWKMYSKQDHHYRHHHWASQTRTGHPVPVCGSKASGGHIKTKVNNAHCILTCVYCLYVCVCVLYSNCYILKCLEWDWLSPRQRRRFALSSSSGTACVHNVLPSLV